MRYRSWVFSFLAAGLFLSSHAYLAIAADSKPDAKPDPKKAEPKPPAQPLPIPADKSAQAMTLPPGFTATLFAGEPDLTQPIGFTIDHRGRLWVCENHSYAKWREKCDDRIVIYEDTDGDGKFDKKTIFAEGIFHYLTGVQLGLGGVWVSDCPNLWFFPMEEGADKPSGPPVAHLEGWNWKGQHNVINSMEWGPDGWLYGCNGITIDSDVKVVGAPESDRTKVSCGVWRYHPIKKKFERFAEGTTNPWGIDYDERGQMFMSNNVVAHLWHVIQGAHFKRMRGQDFNPYFSYWQIETCADHLHWGGGDWTTSRSGEAHSVAGGGHSHAGAAIYLGDSFPAEYRGTIFMVNTHGHRLNNDSFEAKGSGVVARHRPDFMMANDQWFRGVTVHQGPEGALYVSDWSDTGECHQYANPDNDHGRIYRIAYQGTKKENIDLAKDADEKLVGLQSSTNEWLVRHARMVLHDRAAAGKLTDAGKAALVGLFETSPNPVHRLRALWTLQQCGLNDEARLLKTLGDADPYLRAWSIQFLAEDSNPSPAALEKFETLAKSDESPVVRLYLASALHRTPLEKRWPILQHLVAREADVADQNLPQMYWYALEGLVGADPKAAAAKILPTVKIPKLRELVVRRMAAK